MMIGSSPKQILDGIFSQLKLKAHVRECRREGSFLVCDMVIDPGGKVSRIERYAMEIAISLRGLVEPLIYPIPSKGIVRMELLMEDPEIVPFKGVFISQEFMGSGGMLSMALGRTRLGKPLVVDLSKMPHLLVAGATGSGKSMLLQAMICSLISRKQRRSAMLALIDPKRVEFSCYDGIPHLWRPIALDVESSLGVLSDLVKEMDVRFRILRKHRCRDISHYRGRMPYIVVVIDELADLMMSAKREAQNLICRLAQKSRACGIHMIVATQRPSTDVATGVIKANFPARLSCKVSSATDSRVVLDKNGAEKLLGNGDAILDSPGYSFVRFKGAFLSEDDIFGVVRDYASRPWWSKLWMNSR